MSRVTDILEELAALKAKREPFELTWQEILSNILPNVLNLTQDPYGSTMGYRRDEAIIQGTPRAALATCQAGLMGRLMSAQYDWLAVQTPDEDMMDDRDTRMWLSKLNAAIFSLISRSTFYRTMFDFFGHAMGLGTAIVFRQYDVNKGKEIFSLRNPFECYLADDADGNLDTVYRVTLLSNKQMVDVFGEDNLHEEVRRNAENPAQRHELNQVCHAVYPNEMYNPKSKDSKYKRFASCYVDISHQSLIRESGYTAFPYSAWRPEKEVGEAYGRGAGWRALADIKMLYAISKTNITGAQKQVNPALDIPADRSEPVNTMPGGRSYYEDTGKRIYPIETVIDLKTGLDREQRVLQIVERHFMVPFFTMMQQIGVDTRQRTAYEVQQIEQETALLLGPYATGFQQEAMDPIVEGLVYDVLDNGMIPAPPPQLLQSSQGRKLEVAYSGPLATAARQFFNTEPYRKTIQDINALFSMDPTGQSIPRQVLDIFDWDRWMREFARNNGLPEEAMIQQQQVDAMRKAQQKAMAMQQQLASLQALGKAAPGLSKAPEAGSPMSQVGAVA
jgi:hypothetical protein